MAARTVNNSKEKKKTKTREVSRFPRDSMVITTGLTIFLSFTSFLCVTRCRRSEFLWFEAVGGRHLNRIFSGYTLIYRSSDESKENCCMTYCN